MNNIDIHEGKEAFDLLLQEAIRVFRDKGKVVIAVAGLPGSGKTYMVKHFVRFGFGSFRRKEVAVIDDNILYTTRLWKLKWEKLPIEKSRWREFLDTMDAKVVFFSNWVPSRFIDCADILVCLQVEEQKRTERIEERYLKKAPEKIAIQKAKTDLPIEPPFEYEMVMTLSDPRSEIGYWTLSWLVKRLL